MLGRRHTFTKSQDVSMEMDYKSFRDTITQTSHFRTPYIGARMDIRLQLDCDIDHITQSYGK